MCVTILVALTHSSLYSQENMSVVEDEDEDEKVFV